MKDDSSRWRVLAATAGMLALAFVWACGDAGREPTAPESGIPAPAMSEVAPVATPQLLTTSASSRGSIEICGNGIDDDNDGETDEVQCQLSPTSIPTSDPGGVVPELWDDNPTCQDLGFQFGTRIETAGFTGTFDLDAYGNTVTISSDDGVYLAWSSTFGIDAVTMKGGNNANVYVYDPESTGPDAGLASPENPNNQNPYLISHVDFCYDYEVDVSKDANTSFTRTYDWDISKTSDASYVGFPGDAFSHQYTITVDRVGFTDSDWAVTGAILIENNTPLDATIESVDDLVSPDIVATVTCEEALPHTLSPGESLSCDYTAGLPDGTDRVNTATVTTSGDVGGGETQEDVDFSTATITEIDAEVNVTDDFGTPGDASDDLPFGPFTDDGSDTYTRDFVCPTDLSLYTDGVYTESVTNTATIDETGDSDDASVDLTCYIPATAKVVKTTTEGDEDIGQFPFTFELFDPAGNLVETQELSGSGEVSFATEIETAGTWTVVETLPAGWVSTTALTCTFDVAFPGSAGQTFTCEFDNVEMSRVDVLKLTNGQPTTSQVWTFDIYEGPNGFGGTLVASDATPPALLDFGPTDLDPFDTYTLCERSVPAGWSTLWSVDADGNGTFETVVLPYNPDAPEDLGNRCVELGAFTGLPLTPGVTLSFQVDNQQPGGAPRTPGYWKNWNTCTIGGQAENAARNGGWQEGFWLLDDVLDPSVGGGVVWDDIRDDDFLYPITGCEQAVSLLDQRDVETGRKKASDAAYTLAMHLLAAQLNFGAGACTTQEALNYALEAELLLDALDFDGTGNYLRPRNAEYGDALDLAAYLDDYNNGAFCGDGND